jgi:hypothetical protein
VILLMSVGCGAPQTPAAVATSSASAASPTPSPSPTPPAGALRFTITTEGSKAVVRVNEKLAINSGPTDAVLDAIHCLAGDLVLLPDGTFWNGARITMEMRRLRSDSPLRDKWVELFGPQTGRFPTAELTPQRAEGLPLPLGASGSWTFALLGTMKVHGVEHAVRWNAMAQRAGDTLTTTASTIVVWSDFGIAKPTNIPEVASIVDEIRLEVSFTAKERP